MLFWTLILMLAIILYAILIVWVMPTLILKSKYPLTAPTDRGLKKYKLNDDDYAIVYEPSLDARKYITQYILAKKDGKKTFKCRISPDITYIDFDIVLFDAHGTCFHAINSMDIVSTDGFADEIDLPSQTAYASIIVNQVNNKKLRKAQEAIVRKRNLVIFGIASLVLSVGLSVCSMYAFSNIFGGLFRETFAKTMISSGWVFILPTIMCAVCITGACLTLLSKNSKR